MALVSCLSSNTMSSVGWYVDNGALRHMTYDRSLFNRIQEQEGGMSVELGDDATYPMRGVGSISFLDTFIGDVLELSNVLFVLGLKKNLLSVSCMEDLHCMAEFDAQEVIFRRQTHVVEKGVRVGGLYRLQVDQ
jgi:hypothetical protein